MHFDHDHQTGAFRGWICYRCNTTLGKVGEDPELLEKMIHYLETSKQIEWIIGKVKS